jgi:hypothetical protein
MWRSALLSVALATGAVAQDGPVRTALLVVGDTADSTMRDGAVDLSEILFGMGFAVQRIEDPSPAALIDAATRTGRAAEAVVVIGAGLSAAAPAADGTAALPGAATLTLRGGDVPLADLFAALRAGGSGGALAVVFDACAAGGSVPAGLADALPADTLLALPVAPGATCPADGRLIGGTLAARLALPDTDIATALTIPAGSAPGLWTGGALPQPLVLRHGAAGQALTLADYRMLQGLTDTARAEMVANLRAAGFAVDMEVAAPVAGNAPAPAASPLMPTVVQTLSPIAPADAATSVFTGIEASADELITLASAARGGGFADPSAAEAAGLPRPYIVLGRTPTLLEAVAPPVTDWRDSAARAQQKLADPAAYATLVAAGGFDPPEAELAVALQTVLSEQECYRGGIDGQFGGGSRAALTRYFETAGLDGVGQDATIAVWRQVIAGPVVVCPAPPPQPVAQRANNNPGPTNTVSRPVAPVNNDPPVTNNRPVIRGLGSGGGG